LFAVITLLGYSATMRQRYHAQKQVSLTNTK
jgi:hypothetical protein